MSDTPRTDAHNWNEGHYDDPLHSLLDFAKQLERELNAANDRIKRLEEAVQRVEDLAHSVQDWSGTALGDALDELNKAKETKP